MHRRYNRSKHINVPESEGTITFEASALEHLVRADDNDIIVFGDKEDGFTLVKTATRKIVKLDALPTSFKRFKPYASLTLHGFARTLTDNNVPFGACLKMSLTRHHTITIEWSELSRMEIEGEMFDCPMQKCIVMGMTRPAYGGRPGKDFEFLLKT
jgi:hypothetical protein